MYLLLNILSRIDSMKMYNCHEGGITQGKLAYN